MANDINMGWTSSSDPSILDDEAAEIQFISNEIFMNTNEQFFSTLEKLDLKFELFEFIDDIGDELPLREIRSRLINVNDQIDLDLDASSIENVDDKTIRLNLSFKIAGKSSRVVRTIENG